MIDLSFDISTEIIIVNFIQVTFIHIVFQENICIFHAWEKFESSKDS